MRTRLSVSRGLLALAVLGTSLPAFAQAQRPAEVRAPFAPPPLPGDTGATLGLDEAMRRFQRENLSLQAARLGVDAARADIIAAGVLTNPNLSVNANVLLHGVPTGAEQVYSVAIDQVIPIAGQVGLRRDVARGYATAAERDFAATAWTLVSNVRDAYLDLQVAQARWRILAGGLGDLKRAEMIISERAAAGANPQYDLVRLQVEKSGITGQMAEAQASLATARGALSLAIGRSVDPTNLVAEDAVPDAPDPPTDIGALVSRATRQRADIAAALARAEAADTKIAQARREYVPSPDVSVGYQPWFNVLAPDGSYGKGGAIFAGVTLPLPVWDRGQGKVDRAAAEARQARTQAEATEIGVRLDVQRAVASMSARVEAWRAYRDTTAAQVEKLRTMAETAYREGKSGIVELLDAYRAYLEAHLREIELRSGAWQAALDLERAVGPAQPQQP